MSSRPLVHRYAPFLAIVGLIGVLMITEPTGPAEDTVLGSDGTGEFAPVEGGDTVGPGGDTVGPGGDTGTGTGTGTAVDAGTGGSGGTAGTTPASGGGGTASTGQRVDALGRPVEGDKGKCAPGGLLQENVTSFSLPCMPRFTGNNGGATYQGVTGEEIKIVIQINHYEPATQAALVAVGLAATDQQYQEASNVYAEFINKHYELHGRKIRAIINTSDCATGDNACYRAEGKAAVARHKPFAVLWGVQGIAPPAFMDEIARARTIGLGAPGLPTEWYVQRRPYMWTEVAQSPASMDNLADYYCKKLWGKNASFAGDPRMRAQKRKLGIIVTEEPENVASARHIRRQVTGGLCGAGDDVPLYTIAVNQDQRRAQFPTLIARMKNDGITTSLQLPSTEVLGCNECDRQQYFPEHLISGQNQNDADIVGRLDASAQRSNRFGIGFRPAAKPVDQWDHRRASRAVRPGYDPELITAGPYQGLAMIGKMIQLAGPRLTPQTVEQGAHTMPQLGGFRNPNPWPGWRGGDPTVPKWHLGGATKYSAWSDAREIYWNDRAISADDGRPGAWVCVSPCVRYEAGEWPKGEPKR